jgi:hypothetical protein
MSVDASFDFRVVDVNSRVVISPLKVIDILSKNGWNLLDPNGYVFYLPAGDEPGMFNWADNKMDLSSLMKIFEQKEKNKELIGVRIAWRDTEIGGNLLLWDKDEAKHKNIHTPIAFDLDANRKMLADYGNFKITDVNWYLERLIPIFNQGDTLVENYTYEEHA